MNSRFDPKQTQMRPSNPAGTPAEQPLSATEARQGSRGQPVLMVLVAGLVLALLAWGAAEWWGQATEPPAQQTATPPAGDNTPATAKTAPSADPAAVPPASNSQPQPAKP